MPEDVDTLQLDNDRLAVTTQTTLSIWDTQDVIDAVVAGTPRSRFTTTSAWRLRIGRKPPFRQPMSATW